MIQTRTIVAAATPPGTSALAVIRVSGSRSADLCQSIFNREPLHRKLQRAKFYCSKDGHLIDDLTFIFYQGPASFTGEDMVELICHGNPLIVRRIVEELCALPGFFPAEPGEFSRRAFENAKIDLVQAEAIGEVIHSGTEAALKNAQKLLRGDLSGQLQELIREIKHLSALLELEADFAEEEADAELEEWEQRFTNIEQSLKKLEDSWKNRNRLSSIPSVALAGAPNAGKSSLINALLSEDRILVSSEAGTTRDYIETRLVLEGGEVKLVDTAGLSETPVSELDRFSESS